MSHEQWNMPADFRGRKKVNIPLEIKNRAFAQNASFIAFLNSNSFIAIKIIYIISFYYFKIKSLVTCIKLVVSLNEDKTTRQSLLFAH